MKKKRRKFSCAKGKQNVEKNSHIKAKHKHFFFSFSANQFNLIALKHSSILAFFEDFQLKIQTMDSVAESQRTLYLSSFSLSLIHSFMRACLCVFQFPFIVNSLLLLVEFDLNFTSNFRTPYVTGSSVVAIKYKDGILMAADMGG